MQSMCSHPTVEEIIPLVEALPPRERARLWGHIIDTRTNEDQVYRAIPPANEEFQMDEDALVWDSEGWENVS